MSAVNKCDKMCGFCPSSCACECHWAFHNKIDKLESQVRVLTGERDAARKLADSCAKLVSKAECENSGLRSTVERLRSEADHGANVSELAIERLEIHGIRSEDFSEILVSLRGRLAELRKGSQ